MLRASQLLTSELLRNWLLLMGWIGSVAALGEESTQWIGDRQPLHAGAQLVLLGQFDLDELPQSAELRVGADFCEARVEFNGITVHQVTPGDMVLSVPVLSACRQGQNRVRVHATALGGPHAIAVELELMTIDGQKRVIRSDDDWLIDSTPPRAVITKGSLEQEHWWQLRYRPSTSPFDEYNQWTEARPSADTPADAQMEVPDGFTLEVLYRVPPALGSWISMTIDDRGRLVVGKEKAGLLRLTLNEADSSPRVEQFASELKGSHGVLWTEHGLFVNASDSRGFYRLRDTDDDDMFDDVRRLREVPGGGGDHGRNDLLQAADGSFYLIHGDAVDLPEGFTSQVPATRESPAGPLGGHVIRTDLDGSRWEVIAAGLRNPYGLAWHRDGELFTYDADSERHVGLPWYRPTRMNHLVPGADYGWRSRGSLPWPTYHADSLPPNVLIGRGSPTSVRFGYLTNFPEPYRSAMFAPDWAFGRLFAVQVIPRGASYSLHPERFLRGRPFNVVDMEFAKDGSMLLLTGGYGTQSVLYRLRYLGPQVSNPPPTAQQQARRRYSAQLRFLRRQLERAFVERPQDVDFVWSHLSHPDRWIRHAARVALEHQPVASWETRLWNETQAELTLPALLAYVRVATPRDEEAVWRKLHPLDLCELNLNQQQVAVRIVQWLTDAEPTGSPLADGVFAELRALYPTGQRAIDRELCSLLRERPSAEFVTSTLELLAGELRQEDAIHYLMELSHVQRGWSDVDRGQYFRLLRGARWYQGDEGLPELVQTVASRALDNVPNSRRAAMASIIAPEDDHVATDASQTPRSFVRSWQLSDFDFSAEEDRCGDATTGKRVFQEALCGRCHRLGTVGRATGPDLTGIAGRFRRQEMLESILTPSKSISSRFTNYVIVTEQGQVITGQVVWNGFRKSILRVATDPLRMSQLTVVSKRDIVSYEASPVSPMPKGLLDTFHREEILGLLAYLESGGR